MKVPTVAAATQTFREAINDGIDGFVANGEDEWFEKLEKLIIDEELFYEKADSNLLRNIPESYEPDMKKIKEHIKTTAIIPAGIDIIPQDSKFYYKLI